MCALIVCDKFNELLPIYLAVSCSKGDNNCQSLTGQGLEAKDPLKKLELIDNELCSY